MIWKYYLLMWMPLSTCVLMNISGIYGQKQSTLSGVITDSDLQPLYNVIVSLKPATDSNRILHFTTSDSKGHWKFKFMLTDTTIIEFRSLGMATISRPLYPGIPDSLFNKIKMKHDPVSLKEVTIVAEKLALQRKGDTIQYNIEVFRTGKEKNLGDLLNTLPGIEVDSEGDIGYNGQRIDKLLIENKDILNDQHKLTTEGFDAIDVSSIDIIESYKDNKDQYSYQSSDKVAMNIKLTQEAKSRWKGNAAMAAGFKEKLRSDLNTFNISEQVSAVFFGRYNNTGSQIMSLNDYLSFQTTRELINNQENLTAILPTEYLIPAELQANNDGLLAGNINIDHPSNRESKISWVAGQLDRSSEIEFYRRYLNSPFQYSGQEDKMHRSRFINLKLNHQWQLKNSWFLEIELPLSVNKTDKNQFVNGQFAQVKTLNYLVGSDKKFTVNPSLYYAHKLGSNWSFSGRTILDFKNYDNDLEAYEEEPLIFFPINEIFQTITQDFTQLNLQHRVEYHRQNISAGIGHLYHFLKGATESKSSPDDFSMSYELTRQDHQLQSYVRFENNKWIAEPAITIRTVHSEEHVSGFRRQWADYAFLGRYSISPLHFLLTRMHFKKYPLSFAQLTPVTRIVEGRILQTNHIPFVTLTEQKSVSLSYLNYNVANKRRFFSALSITHLVNGPGTEINIEEDYITHLNVIIPRQRTISFRNTFNTRLFFSLLQLKIGHSSSLITRTVREQRVSLANNSASITFATRSRKTWDIHAGIRYSNTSTQSDYDNFQNRFASMVIELSPLFSRGDWQLESSISYVHNYLNRETSSEFWRLNFDAEYQISRKFVLTLVAQDLFNLNGTFNNSVVYQSTFVEDRQYIRFPGYLTIGLRWIL